MEPTLTRLPVLLTLLSIACGGKPEGDGAALLDDYLAAYCRVYSDQDCADTTAAECGGSLSFSSEADCLSFVGQIASACPGAEDWFAENSAEAESCTKDLDSIECGVDTMCDESGQAVATGTEACQAVDAGLEAACDGDTGG